MSLEEQLSAPTFYDCLRSVRELSDEQIILNFHSLMRLQKSYAVQRTLLVYYFFFGYRCSLARSLQPFALRFDTAAELAVSLHLLTLVVSSIAFAVAGPVEYFVAAGVLSVGLLVLLRRMLVAESLVANCRNSAMVNAETTWLARKLISRPFPGLRVLLSTTSFFLHDLTMLLVTCTYVALVLVITAFAAITSLSALVASIGWLTTFCLVARTYLQNASPSQLLILGTSVDTNDVEIYLYRERCFPARVSNLLDLKRVRHERISPKGDALRVRPTWYAAMIWPVIVWLEMHSTLLVVFRAFGGESGPLQIEQKMLDRAYVPYLRLRGSESHPPDMMPSTFALALEHRSWLFNQFPVARTRGDA